MGTVARVVLVTMLAMSGCSGGGPGDGDDSRQAMRDFVSLIATTGRAQDPDFLVVPQNGHELLTTDGEPDGPPAAEYVAAIDGVGREDLFYGFTADNVETPAGERDAMLSFMDLAEGEGVEVLVTDYVSTVASVDESYQQSNDRGYISFAADRRELDRIPVYPNGAYLAHGQHVTALSEARNFLYLIDPSGFDSKVVFVDTLRATRYDVLILDAFFSPEEPLTPADVANLQLKSGGGTRIVLAYLSIGEAEDYRYYWDSAWEQSPPGFLAEENPDWPGNYKVRYWDPEWQAIIATGEDAYLSRILDAGFDGVYLDIIDAYEYFE